MGKQPEKKYYGIINGQQGSGIFYGTWEAVKPLVIGVKGAKQTPSHKEFVKAAKDYEKQTNEQVSGYYTFNKETQMLEFLVIPLAARQVPPVASYEAIITDDELIRSLERLSFKTEQSGYLAEDDSNLIAKSTKVKKYRARLLVGEADFSYAKALIKKHEISHPNLPKAITATEYRTKEVIEKAYPHSFKENYTYLAKKDVKVLFSVDATNLHNNELINKHYPRIHFNFPHDGNSFKKQTLPKMLGLFFKSANSLQKKGDRVHIAMPKGKPSGLGDGDFYQGYYYDIYNASMQAGYIFIKKRKFINDNDLRYPEYQHCETNASESAKVTMDSREFIFEKTGQAPHFIKTEASPPRKSKTKIYGEQRNCLPDRLTTSESSDYIEEEEASISSNSIFR